VSLSRYPTKRDVRLGGRFAGDATGWTLDFAIKGIASIEKSLTAEDCTEGGQATTETNAFYETSLLLDGWTNGLAVTVPSRDTVKIGVFINGEDFSLPIV
jgi:hypothetical protein